MKKPTEFSVSFEHRAESDLPEGWTYAPLGSLGAWSTGNTPSKANARFWAGGTLPWVSPKDMKRPYLDDAIDHVTERAVSEGGATVVPPGTLFFVVRGMILAHTFPVALATKRVAFNQDMRSLVPIEGVYGPYLLRALQREAPTILGVVREATHGTLRLETDTLQTWPIPVAPMPEQRRIVAKVEALLEQVNRAKARLDRLPLILERFRKAVLAAACSDGEEANVDGLVESIRYGTAVKCSPTSKGTPVLRIPNIVSGVINQADMKYGPLSGREKAALNLVPGDILMIRSNGSVGLVGRTALVTEKEDGCSFAGYLMRLRPNPEAVVPEYLHLALQSHDVRVQIEMPARSTSGVHNINAEEVRALRVRVPSVDHQKAAIERVRGLFALCDAMERRVATAAAGAENLPQAILAKAFSGELVPLEAELARIEGRAYETAEELLSRVRGGGTSANEPSQRTTTARRTRKNGGRSRSADVHAEEE